MDLSTQDQITIENICSTYHNCPSALVEILHDVQSALGFIAEPSLTKIANALNITRTEAHGVVSFYEDFKTSRQAKLTIKICRGEACQSMDAQGLFDAAHQLEAQGEVAIKAVYCLGNCALAPAALIGKNTYGRLTPIQLAELIKKGNK